MQGFIIDLVFQFLPVDDLITCALVNKEFCDYARRPGLWNRHKERILREMPALGEWLNDKQDTRKVFLYFLSGKLSKDLLFCWVKYAFENDFVIEVWDLWDATSNEYFYKFRLFKVSSYYDIEINVTKVEFHAFVYLFRKFLNNDSDWFSGIDWYIKTIKKLWGFNLNTTFDPRKFSIGTQFRSLCKFPVRNPP